ncbi:C6 zinc finger domain-containing protein [Cordyceps javanica]|uniref:C6 zinc finger domain-containing protein n=1 Tax=Cordyceps javanica TaxID=43265 RepID=A0A545VMV2_9HYPO|nr:C6 zinc finger domain-containing protein [Cordyceps javanica]TQW03034.1 C6 zinc finger domain protein [Cordyceps javanica]
MGNVITFLADEFNGDLWRYSLPQMMHNAEAIWHGSNAIASLSLSHRAIDDGSAKESTRQYSMSMKHILGITQSPYITPQNKAIVLLANVLYGVYALFTGDTVANMTLHEKTRRLIRHWRFWECTEAAPVSALAMHLLHHFLKSSTLRQEALFISPEPPGQTWIEAITWFQKRPIRSINQAYVEFEMMWISVRATLDNIPFRPTRKDILVADAGRSVLRQQFESWALRYRAFKSARAPISLHASILKVRSILINILFKLDLDSAENLWDETCWDAFDIEFAAAFRALQAALGKENKAARRAEFDTQFTPSLYKALTFITRTCRRPVLRRDAIALLRTSLGVATGRLSRITGNPVMEFIADQIIDVEEVAWRDAKSRDDCAEGSKCVKDKFICNMHRIARVVAPREIPERIVNYTLLTTGDILNGREGHRESVRAVFFS